jgi:hypothetical protein
MSSTQDQNRGSGASRRRPEPRDTAGFNRGTLELDVPLPWSGELQHAAGLDRTLTTGPRLDAALSLVIWQ